MFKVLLFLLLCISIFSQSSLAQNQCSDLFNNTPPDPTALSWVKNQRHNAVTYIRNSKVGKIIEKMLRDFSNVEKDVKYLDTDSFAVSIVDKGLAPRTPVDVIYFDKKTKQSEVLLSSLKLASRPDVLTISKYKNNNTIVPVEIQLSPLRDFLLVSMSANGSIDVYTLVIIDLKSKKILREIENVSDDPTVWLTPRQFIYSERTLDDNNIMVTIDENNSVSAVSHDTNILGSKDQQWTFKRMSVKKSQFEYLIQSTTKKINFKIEANRILSIFKSTPETLWIQTEGASGFREILKVNIELNKSNMPSFKLDKVVPESNMVIESAKIIGTALVVSKYLGADRVAEIRDLNGKLLANLKIPGCCFYSVSDYNSTTGDISVTLGSPIKNTSRWVYNINSKKWFLISENKTKLEADPDTLMMIDTTTKNNLEYVTEYKSYRSKDGTEIPVRVTYRKNISFGNAPVLMEAYGGFATNNYFHPDYKKMTYEFIKAGGVHVAPAVRGSYYYGKRWHDEGRALNKQNVIDDFIGAAEWIISQGITTPNRIAISGASHGGLLVGAAVTQRPDLFGLALPQFGPLLFHDKPKLDPLTTPFQKNEYGDLYDDPAAIENAKKISPYLNLRNQNYPMTFVITGRMDSRVNPQHSYYFAQKMMEMQKGDQPIYLYTNSHSGHWMSSIQYQDFLGWRTHADIWTVIFEYFKLTPEMSEQDK